MTGNIFRTMYNKFCKLLCKKPGKGTTTKPKLNMDRLPIKWKISTLQSKKYAQYSNSIVIRVADV